MAEIAGAEGGIVAGLKRRPRIFYGWYVVAAAAAINVYGAGVWFYGFPIFYKALLDDFGWTAAGGAAVISLSRLEGGIEGPIIGWAVDKFGPRLMAVLGAVITGLGFLAMSVVTSFNIGFIHLSAFVAFALLYAGWMSIGYNTGFGHASMASVNAWFIKKRSRAFAVFSLGAGGSGFTVFFLGYLVDSFGWRASAFLAGVGIFVIIIPLSLLLRHKPEQYGYLPDGEDPNAKSPPVPEVDLDTAAAGAETSPASTGRRGLFSMKVTWPEYDFTVKQALSTFSFWMLILGTGARSFAMTSIVVHEIVYLTAVRDIPLVQASAALGGMVSISLVGRLGFGILGDFLDKRLIMIFTILLQTVGIYILMTATSMAQVWLFVVVYGISYGGAIPVYMAIVGEYFGRKNYATIRGFNQLFHIPTTVSGPIFAGWIYDTTGSYTIAFSSFIVAMLVGVAFLFFAHRPRPPVDVGTVAVPSTM
ncbi:MFS transporter [SAR202 cluster bacterium AC-647-N09_OGT_505m]|nr:MFS transporter [SAR202 cluster bacterium AC-647-N09_OGT_505m]